MTPTPAEAAAVAPAPVGVPGAGAAPVAPPTMAEMAHNIFSAAQNFIASGARMASAGQVAARLSMCKECPQFDPNQWGGRCLKCGCATFLKLRSATEKCPLGIWGEIPAA